MRQLILLLSSIGLLFSPNASAASFIRGDANSDGVVDVTDVSVLFDAFFGGGELDCEDAADANDDGFLDISDPSYVLAYLFWGSAAPPEPFAQAGADPTDDQLTCGDESCDETVSVEDLYVDVADASDAQLGDLDGDGDLDLVVADYESNEFSVRFNAGDGTFSESAVYDSLYHPTRLALSDVDADLDLDLVIENEGACLRGRQEQRTIWTTTPRVAWRFNPRTLREETYIVGYSRSASGFELVWVCLERAEANIKVHANAGDGSFDEPEERSDENADLLNLLGSGSAHPLESSDLDGNGEDDSITVDAESISVTRNGVCPAEDAE